MSVFKDSLLMQWMAHFVLCTIPSLSVFSCNTVVCSESWCVSVSHSRAHQQMLWQLTRTVSSHKLQSSSYILVRPPEPQSRCCQLWPTRFDSATCLSSRFLPCNATLTFSLSLWTACYHVLVALILIKGHPTYPHSHMVKTTRAERKSYEIRAHFDIYQVLNQLSETLALVR